MATAKKTRACAQCASNPLLRSVCTACGGTGVAEKPAAKRRKPALAAPITGDMAPPLELDLPPKPGPFADPLSALRGVWGYPRFRPGQREVIDHLMAGGDAIGIMPTSAGKSLLFQLPALIRQDRPVMVLSPLIALMRDQVQRALSLGIPAVAVTSQHSPAELSRVMAAMPRSSLIYAAPERFDSANFHAMLSVNPPWLVAVDESHQGTEAGLSFRPAYRFVRDLLDRRSGPMQTQWLAVTASATEEVVQDIRDIFRLPGAQLFRFSCDRPNLSYRVQHCPESDKFREVKRLLELHLQDGGAAIVYTLRRRDAEELAAYLRDRGRPALHYHAGMTGKGQRQEVEEAFFGKRADVVVATCAFGMGIDRSDVRLVCMAGMPQSTEDFYQMAGRGGRDGRPSVAVALYEDRRDYNFRKWLINNGRDLRENQYTERYGFQDSKFDLAKQRQLSLLAEVDRFLRSGTCRAVLLRRYFGEESGRPCGNCDNCLARAPRRSPAARAGTAYEIGALVEPKGEIARQLFEDSLNDPLGDLDEGADEIPF